MSSTSRVLGPEEHTAVTAMRWRESGLARPRSAPSKQPDGTKPGAAPTAELERIEREAYKRGLNEGKSLGREQADAEVRPVIERLTQSLAELAALGSKLRRDAEKDVVKLSIAIARRVLHRELTLDPESIAGLIKAALEKLESRELARVRIHPDQQETIHKLLARLSNARIELVPDSTLNKGDVLFETAHGTVDASVEAQLREIERGLTDRLQK